MSDNLIIASFYAFITVLIAVRIKSAYKEKKRLDKREKDLKRRCDNYNKIERLILSDKIDGEIAVKVLDRLEEKN